MTQFKFGGQKPRIVLILQARMGSSRLPGKSMLDLAGAPLLGRILERVKRATLPDVIVVATTDKPQDDVIANLANEYGVEAFRGSENDLVDRYYRAAKTFHADILLRIPADNATPEPSEIDRIIEYHLNSDSVFSSNLAQVMGNNYPDGIGAEVIDVWAFEEIWKKSTDPHNREHAATNFFDYGNQVPINNERYPVGTVPCPPEFARPDLVLDINSSADYEFIRELYEYLYPHNPNFHITDTIAWYDNVYKLAPEKSVATKDYHDYVFDVRGRRFVGKFDEMYRSEDAGAYDSWLERDLRPLRKRFALQILSQYNFNSILEVGCGKGTMTHLLKKKNNCIVATDISPTAIEKARSSYKDIDFRVMTADESCNIQQHFDLVLVMGVFAYVETWRSCLAKFPALANYCFLAEYIPPNPIGYVKSVDQLTAEFHAHFQIESKVIIDDHFCMLMGKSRG